MATSLSQQLQRLALPQTGITLADAHSRASIIFDPKEAATKDRRTIYELALNGGLRELIQLNPIFSQFEQTLFDENTIELERAVQQSDVNKLLDANIKKFLQHLSPYLLLRPAHMCFEWLLRRFHVHEYNRREVMALILPYHETNIFVRILQTMRLRRADAEWDWLHPIEKSGVPLPKSAIINRAATNPAFFNFICQTTLDAIKELSSRASTLQTQINFYTTIVVGALQNAQPIREWHISALLESLLMGLSSDTVDFVSSAYIIVAQLVSRTKLKPKLCNALVDHIANCGFERLHTTALLLLIWIFDTQQAAQPKFKPDILLNLVRQKWLTLTLATLAKENIDTQSICKPLLRGAVAAILAQHAEQTAFKLFLERLLFDIEFSKSSAEAFINSFLDAFVASESKKNLPKQKSLFSDVIELDSDDDEMTDISTDFQSWYSDYLFKLERQYPEAFDSTIKSALNQQNDTTIDSNRRKAIKLALGFHLKSHDENTTSIYECLYHYNADIRLNAVETLLHNLNDYQNRGQNYQLLKECLGDRIGDDNEHVVDAVIQLSTKDLNDILGTARFTEALFGILKRAQLEPRAWQPLIQRAVLHLTSNVVCSKYDTNLILLALMPILFPDNVTKNVHNALVEILGSKLADKLKFLRTLKISARFDKFNLSEYKQHFLDNISSATESLNAISLLESVRNQGGVSYIKEAARLTHLLILLTACLREKLEPNESHEIYNEIVTYSKNFQFKQIDKNVVHKNDAYIPLQLYTDFVTALVKHTEFEELCNWCNINDGLRFALYLLDTLSEIIFKPDLNVEARLEWTKLLKECLDSMLPNAQMKIEFLLNFSMHENLTEIFDNLNQYTALRLCGFKLLQAVLRNKNNKFDLNIIHILKLTCALSTPHQTLRLQTLETLKALNETNDIKLEKHLQYFVSNILTRTNELSMDHEQFALILYTILRPTKATQAQKSQVAKIQREILQIICDRTQPATFIAAVLKSFKHLNDANILTELLPLAHWTLAKQTMTEFKQLTAPYSDIYQQIVERFDTQVLVNVLTDTPKAWELFEATFELHDVYIKYDDKLQPFPCLILNVFMPETIEALPTQYRNALLNIIIKTVAKSDNDSIFLAAHKLLKKCKLDCKPLVEHITKMYKTENIAAVSRTPKSAAKTQRNKTAKQLGIDCSSLNWKQGIALLELLEHKKLLENCELLIAPLFDLLKSIVELEDQSALEYAKQLILATLLHCCQSTKVQLHAAVPASSFRIEQVVQCLRATQNPQTQQSAMLFLTHCASIYPQQVLHNIVAIFTFVGTSVVRHDDAYSFHIINNIIESIIPILIQRKTGAAREQLVIPVLKVFSDIMLDVPEHRRLPLYLKFLQTLGATEHMWQFLCVVFDAHLIAEEAKSKAKDTTTTANIKNQRIDIAQQLILTFTPEIIIQTCEQLIDYLNNLPLNTFEKTTTTKTPLKNVAETTEITLFDIKTRSSKQLRHYKYLIIQFLSDITSSEDFLRKTTNLSKDALNDMKPYYQHFIIKTLSYLANINNALNASKTELQIKYYKVMQHHVHDVLDNAISLLSPNMFLRVVTSLMEHALLVVRKKVIELLINKLQQQQQNNFFANCDSSYFKALFTPLTEIIEAILTPATAAAGTVDSEVIHIQQTALIAIKLLSKQFALQHIAEFKSLLITLTTITKERARISDVVVANVVLTLIEISSNLKAHSLAQLPKFMPHIMAILKVQVEHVKDAMPDNVCLAIIAGIQRIFESLPLFLGPYIVGIINALATISSCISANATSKDQRAALVQQKISAIWTKMATAVPVRILVPSCEESYKTMLSTHSYDEISVLMILVLETIQHNNNAELSKMHIELSAFFLETLEFRLQMKNTKKLSKDKLAIIETDIINAFVAWILKLSENTFRPMYTKVYSWALKHTACKETILTYFLLTNKIAEALKSLFVLFANDFIVDAARLLDECNTIKQPIDAKEKHLNIELLKAILGTLYHIFLHDSNNFVNSQRFGMLVLPIVDQLENNLVLEHEDLQQTLMSCIAQLAVDVSNDVLWKQLNHQVLLKTRANEPEVRIYAFNCCVEIARKLGEDFSPLLPETVPFIAELLEDENSRVEKNTRKSVQELEQILGESLQKYL